MNLIKAWIFDIFYLLSLIFQINIKTQVPSSYLNSPKKEKNPVFVIHGYLASWRITKKIADDISSKGYSVYVFPQLGRNTKSFPESLEIIEDVIEKNKLKEIIIVGYSKGGLIGKSLLIKQKNTDKIKGLITVATPFYGSKFANYFKFLKSNEFYPDNKLIKDLLADEEVNNKIIAISSSHDSAIIHEKKATLPGARKNISVNTFGHVGIVLDKETRKKVIESVEELSN